MLRIKATAVNSGEWRLRKADPFAVRFIFGLIKPKINILGAVFSGEVERVGEDVKHFKVGDFVFGHTDMSFGAYAEYKCLPENASIALNLLIFLTKKLLSFLLVALQLCILFKRQR